MKSRFLTSSNARVKVCTIWNQSTVTSPTQPLKIPRQEYPVECTVSERNQNQRWVFCNQQIKLGNRSFHIHATGLKPMHPKTISCPWVVPISPAPIFHWFLPVTCILSLKVELKKLKLLKVRKFYSLSTNDFVFLFFFVCLFLVNVRLGSKNAM